MSLNRPKGNEWWDYSWNPDPGCERNCWYCWARDYAEKWYKNGFTPAFFEDRLDDPGKVKKPSRIFYCSMGDPFTPGKPDEWKDRIFDSMRTYNQHSYLFLTKFPWNMIKWKLPENCWVGTSIAEKRDLKNLAWLLKAQGASVLWVSFEPLMTGKVVELDLSGLQWIVIGARTDGRGKTVLEPNSVWVEILIRKARENNIAVFLKNNLTWKEEIKEFPQIDRWGRPLNVEGQTVLDSWAPKAL